MTTPRPFTPRPLCTNGPLVGPLAVSGGYGAPAAAFEMAFERGCNYFYHGSIRRPGMNEAIKTLVKQGKRDELVIVAQLYTRFGWHARWSFDRFLQRTGLDHVDGLLLGWYNGLPSKRILDVAAGLKERGRVRHVAISGHTRPAFVDFAETDLFDWFHVRYNAVHRGAERDLFPRLVAPGPGVVAFTATCWSKLIDPKRTPPGERTPRAPDAYRYALGHPRVDAVVAGPSTLAHMEDALTALDAGPMTEDELAWMRRVGDHIYGKARA